MDHILLCYGYCSIVVLCYGYCSNYTFCHKNRCFVGYYFLYYGCLSSYLFYF